MTFLSLFANCAYIFLSLYILWNYHTLFVGGGGIKPLCTNLRPQARLTKLGNLMEVSPVWLNMFPQFTGKTFMF